MLCEVDFDYFQSEALYYVYKLITYHDFWIRVEYVVACWLTSSLLWCPEHCVPAALSELENDIVCH